MAQDWKQLLGQAFQTELEAEKDQNEQAPVTTGDDAISLQGKQRLDIVLDRKGRKGKTATIVTGFVADDAAVEQVASQLKRHCGVGGSSRGGEILLQGDRREQARAWLVAHGLNARII